MENQDDEISERVEDISENEETNIVHEIDENGSKDKVIEGVQDIAPVSLNINDPRIWDSLDGKMRDLLVEKGVPREIINIYPRHSLNRGFSSNYYFQKMSNGELFDRKCRDWKHLGDKLTDLESSQQIKKDTDHWRDVIVRIISVVKL
ncbi:hypothetical protein OROMI_000691 [Orobanche minor]